MKGWPKWVALSLAVAFDPETVDLLVWAAVAIVVALVELAGVVITARATVQAASVKAMIEHALEEAADDE